MIEETTLECPQCGYTNEGNSKFCQECGKTLGSEIVEAVTDGEAIEPLFSIEFPFSSSANYEFAVEAAKKSPSYVVEGEGKKLLHRTSFTKEQIDPLLELIERLKGWRNRTVYVEGKKMPWDAAFGWTQCYQRRQSAYDVGRYCFGEQAYEHNIWGCSRLGLSLLPYEPWLAYGKMDQSGTFHFDKARIEHELNTGLAELRLCPALDEKEVRQAIAAFPEKVNPEQDKGWEYVTEHNDDFQEIAVGVKPSTKAKATGPVVKESPQPLAQPTKEAAGCGAAVLLVLGTIALATSLISVLLVG